MSTEIYTPPLTRLVPMHRKIMLGLIGEPFTGKTTSASTFPNPIFADFDGKCPPGANHIPFYDANFIESVKEYKLMKTPRVGCAPNRRDAFLHFLRNEAVKFTSEQTLVVDSWTALQQAFDTQQSYEPVFNSNHEIDTFKFWAAKMDYAEEVCEALQGLSCHVVVTMHEQRERDKKTGYLIDKIKPLMQGQFASKMASKFTDWFRTVVEEKTDANGKLLLDKDKQKQPVYYWQTKPDGMCNANSSTMEGQPIYVEPTYQSFLKYGKKISPDKTESGDTTNKQ